MKKKLLTLIALSCFLVAGMLFASPAAAFSSLGFFIPASDGQPWGTTPNQSYRIYVLGSTSGELLDTGTLTTPAAPVLDFDCAYGAVCPAGVGGTLTAPVAGETVTVYVILTGENGTPSTITRQFTQPPIDLGIFTINQATGTGPTAVTLSGFDTNAGFNANYALAALFLLLGGASVFALRRRSAVQA